MYVGLHLLTSDCLCFLGCHSLFKESFIGTECRFEHATALLKNGFGKIVTLLFADANRHIKWIVVSVEIIQHCFLRK